MTRLSRPLFGLPSSRFAAFQRLFNMAVRESYLNREDGSVFSVWDPPGILFFPKRVIGAPDIEQWGFEDMTRPMSLDVGCGDGDWVLHHCLKDTERNWVAIDTDNSKIFNSMLKGCRQWGIQPENMRPFPNLRLAVIDALFVHKWV
eukprot:Cvel_10278.t1-p1 / transcript=Cvel_10278.t1 / gene=Cvel_10278 / organism=Chromera_velia_CCMP2878 / gene_product=hypothetical protein / transcript_product=hypothetical protein / location=Cvel_scaffold617:495-1486(-) / protein_length=145 / sequence_SO=supercontig / SO=protein_coding / is_pseudo=false